MHNVDLHGPLFMLTLAVCTLGFFSQPRNSHHYQSSNEQYIFGKVVEYFVLDPTPSHLNGKRKVMVDPVPLKPDPAITEAITTNFALLDGNLLRERAKTLKRLNVKVADISTFERCKYYEGRQPPPQRKSQKKSASLRSLCEPLEDYMGMVVGLSRPGRACFPPENIDECNEGIEEGFRVARVIAFTTSSWEVYDVVLKHNGEAWHVLEKRLLVFMAS